MEQLIAAVRNYPCLWNTTAIEYRDQELKDAAWAEVMKETSLSSVKEVKLKWKKLRDSYRDALKRASELQARDPAAAHAHAPRKNYPWKYMTAMAFLQPHMSARKKPADEPPASEHNGHEPDEQGEHGSDERNGEHEPERSSEESDSDDSAPAPKRKSSQLTLIDRKLDYLCKAQGIKRRMTEAAYAERRARASPSPPPPPPPPPPPAPADDPIDIFFSSMCQTTKRFPYPAQIKVKRALFEAVTAGEEALLAEQQSYASLWARAASESSSEPPAAAGAGAAS